MSRKGGFTGANAIPLGPRNPAIGAKRSFSSQPPDQGQAPPQPSLLNFQKQESTVSSNAASALRAAQAAAANLAKLQNLKPTPQPQAQPPQPESDEGRGRPKKKRSRWSTPEVKTEIPGIPARIPPNLTKEQQSAYITQLQIEDVTRKLKSGDLGIPANPEDRSPSPEPIYNNEGKRLNTREYRTRKRLEDERHRLIQEMMKINENYKPPMDYKPPVQRISEQIMIPADLNPSINFVGLLIGPRGNTLKKIEKDCQCKIMIRGKGSVKEGKIGRKDGLPLPGEDEPLHALVTGTTIENVQKACKEIQNIIKQGIEQPEGQNDLRKLQLMELARLNGTLRDDAMPREREWLKPENQNITNTTVCTKCGGRGHIAQDCMATPPSVGLQQQENQGPLNEADKAKMDSEYLSLMAELGEGPAPDSSGGNSGGNQQFGGPRPPWMSGGPRGQGPYGGGGGNMGPNGPQGSYPPPLMSARPWGRGSPRGGGGRGGGFGNRGRGRGRGGGGGGFQNQNSWGGYGPDGSNMGGNMGNMGNMGWGMNQYDPNMGYGMDGSMGMGGGMGMNPPPPPPPGSAPQQPPPPPSGPNNNNGSWQGDQSWGNQEGDKGQEQGDQSGNQGDGNDYSGNQNSGNMNNQQQMAGNMMGGYGNMMGYGMWGGMGNMAQPPMPPGPGPVPPPPPSGGSGNGNNSGNDGNQSGNNQQWGMDYNNMGGGMNMMNMGMMGFGMPQPPPPPPPSS